MLEMYVAGVSTRKVSKIVEELCGTSVSKSFVSSLTELLDPMVNEWQNRSLSGTNYPYLMTDVLYIKVREDHRVLSKSCHIAIGITEGGDREIIGFMIQNEESDDTWSIFFEYLKERGLQGTELIISDAHKGLVSAIRKSFTNASWQRCQVHFLNMPPKKCTLTADNGASIPRKWCMATGAWCTQPPCGQFTRRARCVFAWSLPRF